MRLRAGLLLSAAVGGLVPFVVVVTPAAADPLCQAISILCTDPPENDDFADGVEITTFPGKAAGTLTESGLEAGEPQPSCASVSETVWYKLAPDALSAATTIQADTWGSGNNTVVSVYTGSGLTALTEVGCNDDSSNAGGPTTASQVIFDAAPETVYYFQVASGGGFGGGSFTLNIVTPPGPPPANDDIANATSIAALPFSDTVNTTGATYQPGEGPQVATIGSNCGSVLGTVWYELTGIGGLVSVDTAGSTQANGTDMGGAIGVYRLEANGSRSVVACSFEPTPTGLGALAVFRAEASRTYLIQTAGAFGASGNLNVHVAQAA